MFKYYEYEEIAKAKKIYDKLSDASYKAEFKFYKTNSEEDNLAWKKRIEESRTYNEVYSKIIFGELARKKPKFLNKKTKKWEKWEDVVGLKIEQMNENAQVDLVGSIEGWGLYSLPKEFYK